MAKKDKAPKKINITNMNKADTKAFTTTDLVVEVQNQDFIVRIDDVFRTSKMDNAFQSFGSYMDYCEEKDIDWNAGTLNLLVMLENFTDIKFPDSILNKLQLMVSLTDHGVIDKIFEAFDKEQMGRLQQRFEELNDTLPKMVEEYVKINNKYTEDNINKINDSLAKSEENISEDDKSDKTDTDG